MARVIVHGESDVAEFNDFTVIDDPIYFHGLE